jgi:hypothetical protein
VVGAGAAAGALHATSASTATADSNHRTLRAASKALGMRRRGRPAGTVGAASAFDWPGGISTAYVLPMQVVTPGLEAIVKLTT